MQEFRVSPGKAVVLGCSRGEGAKAWRTRIRRAHSGDGLLQGCGVEQLSVRVCI